MLQARLLARFKFGLLGGLSSPPGSLLEATLGAQKGPRRPLKGAKNHRFYKGFWRFCVFGTFCKKYTVKGAVLAIWEGWGASWGLSWERPGGCSGAAKGLLGASLVRLGASWGPPGGLLVPVWDPKRPLEAS